MTLSTRNRLLITGMVISVLPMGGILLSIVDSFKVYPPIIVQATMRSRGFLQFILTPFFKPSPYPSFASIIVMVVYALIMVFLIYFFFEKTHSPEILFFALFALSFSLEIFRLALPLTEARGWPPAYRVTASRIVLFGRQFGILSIFITGIYATGWEFQKHGNIILIITAAALLSATIVPLDGLSWDTSGTLIIGYTSMFMIAEIGIILITILSFFIAAYSRGAKEFTLSGVGLLLVCLGRDSLLRSDTWIALGIGTVSLFFGSWLVTTRLHRFYLWM